MATILARDGSATEPWWIGAILACGRCKTRWRVDPGDKVGELEAIEHGHADFPGTPPARAVVAWCPTCLQGQTIRRNDVPVQARG